MSIWKKIKLRSYFLNSTKFNSSWSIDLNVKGNIFNLWKSIFENVFMNQGWEEFLNNTKLMENTDKCAYVKIKQFCFINEK